MISHPQSTALMLRLPRTHRAPYRRRSMPSGFTLIELLVVIAIVGILLAIMLPAVQQTREAVRKVQCQNNLRQIGLAMHSYENSYRTLPWGAKGGWGPSWTTDLLAYLEQPALAASVPYGEPGYATGNSVESRQFRALATAPVMTFRCPSQHGPRSIEEPVGKIAGRVLNSYLGNAGSNVVGNHYTRLGKIGMEAGNGVLQACDFCHQKSAGDTCDNVPEQLPIPLAQIHDGLAYTLLVGETRYIEPAQCGVCDHFMLYHTDFDDMNGHDFSEALASLRFGVNLREAPKDQLQMSLGSYHPGGTHLLMCDASVGFVSDDLDQKVRLALGSRNEFEIIERGDF